MVHLELPNSPVPLPKFHRHGDAIRRQPARGPLPQSHSPDPGQAEASRAAPHCGVGLSLSNRRNDPWANIRVRILAVKPRSPAGFCGRLALDDEVLAVNEQCTQGMDAAEVSRLVRGPEGSIVRLALRKCTDLTYFEVVLMRADILQKNSVLEDRPSLDGSIGVTVVNGKIPGTWQAKYVKLGGGAWLGSPDWSREGQAANETCLLDGDVIWSVNDLPVRKIQKPQSALRGIPFTRVSLEIQREPQAMRRCVDIVRSQLLEDGDLDACIEYRTNLGEILKCLVARFPQHPPHMVHRTESGYAPFFDDAGAQHQSWADCGRLQSTLKSTWQVDCCDGHDWRVQGTESTPSHHLRPMGAASPCGSVDSLDAVIQRLDKASSSGDVTQRREVHAAGEEAIALTTPIVLPDTDTHEGMRADFSHSAPVVLHEFKGSDASQENGRPSHSGPRARHEVAILELGKANTSDRWLCVQRDLSWMSPRRTPGRKSRSSHRSPRSRGHVSGGRRSKDGRYRLDDSGPVHMRVPENWSPWSYAGDAAYLIAVHFQSGVENTHMCYEIQKMSIHAGHSSLPEQPEAAAWYSEGSLRQVPSLHPSPSVSPDYRSSAEAPAPQDKALSCNASAEERLTDSVSPNGGCQMWRMGI